jgi:23S rRNA (uracil1939-C5)-methyltransferase
MRQDHLPMSDPTIIEATIVRLGARGDGVALLPDGRSLYIAETAPGDRVRAAIEGVEDGGVRGRLVEVLDAGAVRAPAPCPHFGVCGGCALQHLTLDAYRNWKRALLVDALARNGVVDGDVADLATVRTSTRRRGTFFAAKNGGAIRAGFHERGSHHVAAIDQCVVLAPELVALVAALPPLMTDLLGEGERAEIIANLLDTGVDALMRLPRLPDLAARERLARFARAADLARLSVARAGSRDRTSKAEPLVARRPALASFGGVKVPVPPGAFLQASADAEALMIAEVRAGIGAAKRVADLFAGAGTFAFALIDRARVHAVEGDSDLAGAVRAGAAKAAKGARVSIEVRDLFRRPLLGRELDGFDAVVFDPPRAGAKAQAEALAQSRVPRVIAVSCNPQTFARDARVLQDGGYRLIRSVPIDQFLWTHHLEVVGTFVR